ncbi:hypothetical protein SPRG_15403 [Saprolegnia parasitica CBS 223.65]|uniref:Uncharacterized protein n=1 Tax=Saprolegnia parasitica (strain CBS 223.65) TaxID=695850 RepID=A0A067BYF0_SAPPC|nr:hypothetical protein SPRG_15403 [Saprolegnia parasitica CBS 223.65]KDO19341.1 hypothetical protein SPRG_15403 [Saprolegnia parasitica CBS 223.65]|eukprot:XP_012209961.1 hypothetical protein SPRG_15403 [Saprolegnia parasitica CBS 223.65]
MLPQGVLFIVATFVIVELAEVGNGGFVYGLLTTVSNLQSAVGSVLANRIYSNFDVDEDAIISDTKHVRNQIAYTYIIYYTGFFIACCTAVFLPKQNLQRTGRQFPLIVGLVLCFCMLVYSITFSILSMFDVVLAHRGSILRRLQGLKPNVAI